MIKIYYDEIGVKTASRYLAHMIKSVETQNFEPSVEEIMDYRWYMILSVCFLWWARTVRNSLFSLACVSGGHVRVNRLMLHTLIYAYTEHAQFVDVSYGTVYSSTV